MGKPSIYVGEEKFYGGLIYHVKNYHVLHMKAKTNSLVTTEV